MLEKGKRIVSIRFLNLKATLHKPTKTQSNIVNTVTNLQGNDCVILDYEYVSSDDWPSHCTLKLIVA